MKQNKKFIDKHNNVTIAFGYGLFALTILTVVIGTVIPLGSALFHPAARHTNIIVLLITFVLAAILPALVSYIVADRATHNKNRLLHRYNGVLFGIAAYWLSLFVTFVGFTQFVRFSDLPFPAYAVVVNAIPVVVAIVVMAIVAIAYGRKKKNNVSVLQYRPYQLVLIGSALAFLIYVALGQRYAGLELLWLGVSSLAIPVVLTIVSYIVLAKYHTTKLARLSDAVIAMSIGGITSSLINIFVAYLILPYIGTVFISYGIAIAVWIAYLCLRRRKS